MKEFFSSLSFKIMIVVAGVLIGLILYEASTGSFSTPNGIIGAVVNPITNIANSAANATSDFFDQIFRSGHYKKENEELKEKINTLQKQVVDYNEIKIQNEQLKDVAGIKEEHPDFEMVQAQVASKEADNLYSFRVNKGSLSQVKKNDPVITSAGLVGIVTAVAPTYCEVTTILSPDIQVSAYNSRTAEAGTVTGKADLALEGQCQMGHIDKNNNISNGDLLVSAGSSGLFPEGIIIGSVLEMQTNDNGMSSYAKIQPSVDFDTITNVTIINSFTGQGH